MFSFLTPSKHATVDRQIAIAPEGEKKAVFVTEYERLYWTALLITGNPETADRALANASKLSDAATPVFRDWLTKWANSATAHTAVEEIRDQILAAALTYPANSRQELHEPLSPEQVSFLQRVEAGALIGSLDPLARSALVLIGVQSNSLSGCARLLRVPRNNIIAAYSRAVAWLSNPQAAV